MPWFILMRHKPLPIDTGSPAGSWKDAIERKRELDELNATLERRLKGKRK